MKTDETSLESFGLSFEKASELGRTLSKGGITKPDSETAFLKKARK